MKEGFVEEQDFFEKYQIQENFLRDTGLIWGELIGISIKHMTCMHPIFRR
jgi:hypothetical protein